MKPEKGMACPVCLQKGTSSELKVFQINLDEAVYMCYEKNCTYPIGADSHKVVKRPAAELSHRKKKIGRTKTKRKSKLDLLTELPESLLSSLETKKVSQTGTGKGSAVESKKVTLTGNGNGSQLTKIAHQKEITTFQKYQTCRDISKDVACKSIGKTPESQLPVENSYLFWKNRHALCWLDVVMCLLVKSLVLESNQKDMKTGVVRSLLSRYRCCEEIYRKCSNPLNRKRVGLETSVGFVPIKTGGGDPTTLLTAFAQMDTHFSNDPFVLSPLSQENGPAIASPTASDMYGELEMLREDIWRFLQPKLQCEKGKNDSPVFALPLLINECSITKRLSWMKYCWRMSCAVCGHQHEDRVEKAVVTFPAVPMWFNMEKPCFMRCCFRCKAPHQTMYMTFDSLPEILWIHFVDGVHSSTLSDYDFSYNGSQYAVSGVIQYLNNPDHFVAWARNTRDNTWLQYNDLVSDVSDYKKDGPQFPPSEVHVVMWEKQSDLCYVKPAKSTQYTELVSKAPAPAAHAHPPPVKRESQPPPEITMSDRNKVKLSHLRPSGAGAAPKPVPKTACVVPKTSMHSRRDNLASGSKSRLEMIKSRLQAHKSVTFTASGPRAEDARINATAVNNEAKRSSHNFDGQSIGNSETGNSVIRKKLKLGTNWQANASDGSYLEAFMPYLKKGLSQTTNPKPGQSFQGYISKAQKDKIPPADRPSSTPSISAPVTTDTKKALCQPRKVPKLKKSPAKGRVSFCDRDGFKIPSNPLSMKIGIRAYDGSTEHSVESRAMRNPPTVSTVSFTVPQMSSRQTALTNITPSSMKIKSAASTSTPGANMGSMPGKRSAPRGMQTAPLDLSPVRKKNTSTPTSPVISTFIDQLCSDLPSELSHVSTGTSGKGDPFDSFGLTSAEMSVMESLTNMLVPDEYTSPKKSGEMPTSGTPNDLDLDLQSFFGEL